MKKRRPMVSSLRAMEVRAVTRDVDEERQLRAITQLAARYRMTGKLSDWKALGHLVSFHLYGGPRNPHTTRVRPGPPPIALPVEAHHAAAIRS